MIKKKTENSLKKAISYRFYDRHKDFLGEKITVLIAELRMRWTKKHQGNSRSVLNDFELYAPARNRKIAT